MLQHLNTVPHVVATPTFHCLFSFSAIKVFHCLFIRSFSFIYENFHNWNLATIMNRNIYTLYTTPLWVVTHRLKTTVLDTQRSCQTGINIPLIKQCTGPGITTSETHQQTNPTTANAMIQEKTRNDCQGFKPQISTHWNAKETNTHLKIQLLAPGLGETAWNAPPNSPEHRTQDHCWWVELKGKIKCAASKVKSWTAQA